MYLLLGLLLSLAYCEAVIPGTLPVRNCVELQKLGLPTGEYNIRLAGTPKQVRVWCEMAIGVGGGYTFVHPTELYLLTPAQQDALLNQIYTDTSNVLLRVRKSNGRQPYAVLKQLNARRSKPIYVGASAHANHWIPHNARADFMVGPYLYVGFFPLEPYRKGMTNGLASNGVQCTFVDCGAEASNYHLAFFPNLKERPASDYDFAPDGWGTQGPCGCIRNSLKNNPSGHVMPGDFFMFTELHWGGCGCFGQTDHTSNVMLGGAIGFK